MMVMRKSRVRTRLRAGARRRHNAGKLRDQKQGDQQPDKPRYRPKPIHQGLDRSPPKIAAIVVSSRYVVNVAGSEAGLGTRGDKASLLL